MITRDFLLGLADNAREAMRLLRDEAVPCDYARLVSLASKAACCGHYMWCYQIDAAPVVGPFGLLRFKAGDRVMIKKDAKIHSVRKAGNKTAKHRFVVTIHRVNRGFIQDSVGRAQVVQPQIVWAGSGGYWRWTEFDGVEPVR